VKEQAGITPRIDSRLAAWISSASPCAAGHYLRSGASLPEPEERSPGGGFGWQDRATAAVLRECCKRALLDPHLERVETVALAVLPEPEDDGDDPPAFFFRAPSEHERWERAVAATAGRVSRLLRYGPTAGLSDGEPIFTGGELEAEVSGLRLRQWIDLLWRHSDGSLEAMLVLGEPNDGKPPPPVQEDWRCILAAAIVRSLYGVPPRVHLVRVSAEVAQAVSFSVAEIEQKILGLARTVSEAAEPRSCNEAITYPLTVEAIEPLRRGEWPRFRPLPPGLRG
jgi:hypothetical protein